MQEVMRFEDTGFRLLGDVAADVLAGLAARRREKEAAASAIGRSAAASCGRGGKSAESTKGLMSAPEGSRDRSRRGGLPQPVGACHR